MIQPVCSIYLQRCSNQSRKPMLKIKPEPEHDVEKCELNGVSVLL